MSGIPRLSVSKLILVPLIRCFDLLGALRLLTAIILLEQLKE